MYLAGDVGGTKSLLALYREDENNFVPIKKERFVSKDFSSLEEILSIFLKDCEQSIKSATIAIAGPMVAGVIKTPNLPWIVEEKKIKSFLGIERVFIINDLLANAYGVQTISSEDFFSINKGIEDPTGNRALISAGTGLGEAGFIYKEKNLTPFPSEGGHCTLSSETELEFEIFRFLKKSLNLSHVSIERVLSGKGLENLYHFFVQEKKMERISADILKEKPLAVAITTEGLKKRNKAASEAIFQFLSYYGSEAGDLALKFLATGGVYIGGGIAPKMLDAFKTDLFFRSFCEKGRLKEVLEKIPIKVILNEETALRGAAFFSKKLL
jgi:glucokinase